MTLDTAHSHRHDDHEIARLLALDSLAVLDTPPEAMFDDLTALAAYVCGVPMAAVSFVDSARQWVKSRQGLDVSEIPREQSICAHTIAGTELLEITDTLSDHRFAMHPMVTGDPHVRFYAGVPLITDAGHAVGTLLVMDRRPRTLSDEQRTHLRGLAGQVLTLLQLRRRARLFAAELESRQTADMASRQQQRMLDGVLEHTDVLVFAKDVNGRFVMANRALEYVIQTERGLTGGTDHDFFEPHVAEAYGRNDRHIMSTRQWQVFSEEVIHPDGSVHTYRSTKFPLLDDGGEVIGVGGVSTDVTELTEARAAHAAAEERWRALVEQSPAAVLVVDADGKVTYVNPEGFALVGATSPDQLIAHAAMDFVPDRLKQESQAMLDETRSGTRLMRAQRGVLCRVDGTELPVEFNATAVDHAGELSVQLEVRDVSAIAAAHAALKHSASTDPLTGLLNRRAWDARVSMLLGDKASGRSLTVAVIDLDNFKTYNDRHGHPAGDALLQRFATAAAASVRNRDVFARWGGEEFIVALPDTTPEQAELILNRILNCVPFGQTCSIGYTAHLRTDTLQDTVIRADRAVYQAKDQGRNQLARL
jgi:diguanylate cyclase (GGDEF)-like protein/PAS domain S-box-containing protein